MGWSLNKFLEDGKQRRGVINNFNRTEKAETLHVCIRRMTKKSKSVSQKTTERVSSWRQQERWKVRVSGGAKTNGRLQICM